MGRGGDHSGRIVGGLALIAVGCWFMLDRLGYDLPGLGDLWPLFLVGSGLVFIGSWLAGRESDASVLVPGVSALGIGLFFFAFTLGPLDWRDMTEWWPVFPVVAGTAFLVTWAAGRGKDPGLLVPAAGGMAVGVVGLLITLGGLRLRWVWQAWPVAIIITGLWILLQGLRSSRPAPRSDGGAPGGMPPADPGA